MLQTLCYVSSSNSNLKAADLEELFRTTKRNNLKLNISGILIFNSGNFLQIMEGEQKSISKLYKKIGSDNKHSNLIKLIESPISERLFEDYETGFSIINDRKQSKQLEDYLNWLKAAEIKSIDNIVSIIEKFIEK